MEAPSSSGLAWWVRWLAVLVPGDIRHDFLGNLHADLCELNEAGASRLKVALTAARELVRGFAQHAPLQPSVTGTLDKPEVAAWSAGVGRIAWWLCGPALFAGYLFGSLALLLTGAGLVVLAFASLVTLAVTAREPLPKPQARFMAAILGGTVAALLLILVFGVLTIALLGLASLFSSNLIAALAVKTLVFLALAIACGVTGSGWVPEEWSAKRLVMNEEIGDEIGLPEPAPEQHEEPAPAREAAASST
ncbi:MAG: hypothetical protein ACYTEZ_13750 [Planctomycetota bacterium]|jgi:hypothetical protein